MKLINLSLVAMMAMGTASFGSEILADTLANGKVTGQATFLYISGNDTDVAAAKASDDKNVGSAAIELNYISGDFHGFKLETGFQSGYDFNWHGKDGSSEDDTRNSVTQTLLRKLNLQYSFLNSNIKVGRQLINTPLLRNSNTFPLGDSFDAVAITLKEIPNTVLKAYYVKEWNKRYGSESNGTDIQDDVSFDDGVYSLYVKNTSIENLTLDGQYLHVNYDGNTGDLPVMTTDGYDQYFVRGKYKFSTQQPFSIDLINGGASFDLDGKEDATFYGLKFSTNINKINLQAAFTTVDDKADYPGALGNFPDILVYTNSLINKAMYAGVDGISLQAAYDFGIKGFKSRVKLAHYNQSDEGISNSVKDIDGADEINLDLNYKFGGALKGFSTRLFMGHAVYDEDVDEDTNTYGRLYIKYNF